MASTKLKKRKLRPIKEAELSDKQRLFAREYAVDLNGTQAAIRAGYAVKSASVTSTKLLKNPLVLQEVGFAQNKALTKVGMRVEEVLEQIHSALTREGKDFIDPATGELIPIHNLPKRANQAIDGIEQEVTIIERENMPPMKVIKTKLKLVPKASAMDMAMKHFGAYAAEKSETTTKVTFEFDSLTKPPNLPDSVEEQIAAARIVDSTAERK